MERGRERKREEERKGREGEEKRERREGERQGEVSNTNNIHDIDPHK